MTREQIMRIASEAGFSFNKYGLLVGDDDGETDADGMFTRFAELLFSARPVAVPELMSGDSFDSYDTGWSDCRAAMIAMLSDAPKPDHSGDANEMVAEKQEGAAQAVATLKRMGYTFHGGEVWRPPLGKRPAWIDDPNSPEIPDCSHRAVKDSLTPKQQDARHVARPANTGAGSESILQKAPELTDAEICESMGLKHTRRVQTEPIIVRIKDIRAVIAADRAKRGGA